ncbi:endomucin isoform X9 [Pseudophryne corroboree]|uniref:endomucin isoform X9 n=1 Tax=Pseudophryne corroboree TaxID=495146 RepID=UPI0030821581
MKPIRAAALVLSVINLLTGNALSASTATDVNSTTSQVSSNTSGVNSTSSEATTQDITDSQTKNGFETSTRLNQSTENYATIPDIGTTEKTKDNITDNITAGPQIVDKVYDQEDTSKNDINGGKPTSLKAKKEIVIGVGCVLSVIVLVVLVFLYKMCQKKAPVSENTELKGSAQNKDSVKLLSVKSATPYTDAKRMSSNQMEFVEC